MTVVISLRNATFQSQSTVGGVNLKYARGDQGLASVILQVNPPELYVVRKLVCLCLGPPEVENDYNYFCSCSFIDDLNDECFFLKLSTFDIDRIA